MAYAEVTIGSDSYSTNKVWIQIDETSVNGTNSTFHVKGGIKIEGYWSEASSRYVNLAGRGNKSSSYHLEPGTYELDSYDVIVGASQKYSASCYGYTSYPPYGGGSGTASTSLTASPKKTYTVTFNGNGGSYTTKTATKTHDTNLAVKSYAPTRTGYNFLGWSTSSESSTVAIASDGSYTENASITLYAVWSKITYTVSYNANGGTGAPSNQTKTYGDTLTLSSVVPTRDKYNFKGWATSASGSVVYQPGGSYTSNSAVTLYAIWEIAYVRATISNVSSVKNNESESGSGTVSVTFSWVVDTTWNASNTANKALLYYKQNTDEKYSDPVTVSVSGVSGTTTITTPTIDLDSTYNMRVEIQDAGSLTYEMYSYVDFSVQGNRYAIDVSQDLHVGVGKAANDDFYLDVQGSVSNGIAIDGTNLLSLMMPVGYVVMLSVETNPADLYGFGTWEQIKDRFLLGAGDTYTAGSTGGSASHSHSMSGSSGSTAITIAQMPAHSHGQYVTANPGTGGSARIDYSQDGAGSAYVQGVDTMATGGGQGHTHTLPNTNVSNHLPPYLAVYIWKRTA